jgi:hypothetical protein
MGLVQNDSIRDYAAMGGSIAMLPDLNAATEGPVND